MSHQAGQSVVDRRRMRAVAAASFAGALMEWYDFFLFGTASALIFGPLFFPQVDPTLGAFAAFATFGVGFIARPLGGIVFGHFGDRFGRKAVLIVTMMTMGIGTFLIGFLPSYEQIGVAAPILLVLLRLVQGLGLGGEYAGAALMTIEHAPVGRRGFWGSLPQAAASGGILLATVAFALVSRLGEEAMLAWGWRIPFLVSAVLLLIGLIIRFKIDESPEFLRARARRESRTERSRMPVIEVLRTYPRNLALALGARVGETVTSNMVNAFGIYYVSTHLGLAESTALTGMAVASVLGLVAVPLIGSLSDRIGRRRIYLAGAVLGVVLIFPMFLMFRTESPIVVSLAFVLVYVLVPTSMFAVQSTFFAEMFGTEVRYTGLSLAYQLSAIIGGYVPAIGTWLLILGGGSPWLVAGLGVLVCVATAVCVLLAAAEQRPAGTDGGDV